MCLDWRVVGLKVSNDVKAQLKTVYGKDYVEIALEGNNLVVFAKNQDLITSEMQRNLNQLSGLVTPEQKKHISIFFLQNTRPRKKIDSMHLLDATELYFFNGLLLRTCEVETIIKESYNWDIIGFDKRQSEEIHGLLKYLHGLQEFRIWSSGKFMIFYQDSTFTTRKIEKNLRFLRRLTGSEECPKVFLLKPEDSIPRNVFQISRLYSLDGVLLTTKDAETFPGRGR